MRTIEVPVYGITVTLDGDSGSIHSSGLEDDAAAPEYRAAIDGLLALVLGHARAQTTKDIYAPEPNMSQILQWEELIQGKEESI